MARSTTIDEVLNKCEHDEIVYQIAGTVKAVKRYYTGENDNGFYSFQNLILSDGRDELKVCLKDREEVSERDWKGKRVYFEAYHGEKGWSGVYAKDEEYQGKITRILWVTKTGQMSLADGDDRGSEDRGRDRDSRGSDRGDDRRREEPRGDRREERGERRDERRQDRPAERQQERAREPEPRRDTPAKREEPARPQRPAEEHPWLRALRLMGQSVNAMNLALCAAVKNVEEFEKQFPDRKITPDQFQAITSSHYITMKEAERRDGVGLVSQMPKAFTPVKRAEAKATEEPERKPESRPNPLPPSEPPVEDDDVPF